MIRNLAEPMAAALFFATCKGRICQSFETLEDKGYIH